MADLAARSGDAQLARSAGNALVHARSLVRRAAASAIVPADPADESLAATGFLILALAKAGGGENQELLGPLRKGCWRRSAASPPRRPPRNRPPQPRGPASPWPLLGMARRPTSAEGRQRGGIRPTRRRPVGLPSQAAGRLAVAEGPGNLPARPRRSPDEKGAFLLAGRPASAVDTALVAVCLAASAARPGAPPDQVAKLRAQIAEARASVVVRRTCPASPTSAPSLMS